ncbi:MAG TPA: DUF6526 family protein [Terracidiphilus sp.]|jgi:hypothetical protein|nr:DUF6526 family protein [Terracidiphilus sp.]
MSKTHQQNLKNHARLDPPFHIVLTLIVGLNLIYSVVHLVRHFGFQSAWFVVLSLGAVIVFLKLRTYPIKVQDRVIRLEERLRLQALAPAEWHTQIYRLSEDQLIGLRFAGDDEVVSLAKQALEENLNRKQIKERIRDWRADEWRI